MKLKADARSDIEGRRKKNLNKEGERQCSHSKPNYFTVIDIIQTSSHSID